MEALLRSSGLRITARPGHEIYLCEPTPAPDADTGPFIEAQLEAVTGLT